MEKKIEIVLVPKEQINEDQDVIRITLEGSNTVIGWGYTLSEAIHNFDKKLANRK